MRFLAPVIFLASVLIAEAAEPLLHLQKGDHIAMVGSGFADRQQHHAWLEAMIQRDHPDLNLTIRNLGFGGDEINVHPRSDETPGLDFYLSMKKGDTSPPGHPEVRYTAGTDFGADVILAYWGFNESFKGRDGLDAFKRDLDAYLKSLLAAKYNGEGAPRVVLFSPIAHENLSSPDFPDGTENNANLALYTTAMAEVAKANAVPFVDLFHPSAELFEKTGQNLTINGIHLTDEGDRLLAPIQFEALFGKAAPDADDPLVGKVRVAVLDKNKEWHGRFRTVDQYNIYGSRGRISYAGTTNNVTLNQEMAQRDVKTANRDQGIWNAANGKPVAVKDDNLPPVQNPPTNRTDPTPYLDPEEAIRHLKVADGCKVELVASEKTFPEFINPVQMNFDTKGRLWIAVWPNYPETTPTTKVFDKLLVIDLDPKTGKAAKMTTFADGLNCPTGFQFYKDGVLVMQSPDLWYLRDTDGDGKADSKERVLHSLDAADSHHETNSMCLEPGGAVYLSDGVFHRSSVETIHGPVRNTDGAIYRYEPGTGKFMRHAAYGFANPHGRVFDYWGNDLITDATGNDNYFGPAMSGHLDEGKHAKMKTFWNRPARPTPGTAILSSRHFPDDWQGLFLNTNVISIQGIFRAKLTEEGSGIKGETLDHLLAADIKESPNFRPSGVAVAPDGSLYVMDWQQMLIGHLQHHLRDPNRDHQYGRLYRITYPSRPLLTPKKIDGQPVAALLDLLKEHEDDVRLRAKIELGKHGAKEVTDAASKWVGALDPKSPGYEHDRLEALWVHQWHNVVDLDLLDQVLSSSEPRARAQAVRVLGYWRDRVPDPIAKLKTAAADPHPRVRLEAVRVASFFRQWEAADAALTALKQPTDYYLDYCLQETLKQLQPWWKDALKKGAPIAATNPPAMDHLLSALTSGELGSLPVSALAAKAILTRADSTPDRRKQALADLSRLEDSTPTASLVTAIVGGRQRDAAASIALASLLLEQPAADLKKSRTLIEPLARAEMPAAIRRSAYAALMLADSSLEPSWQAASGTPAALTDWLQAIPALPDAKLRATAIGLVMPLLSQEADALAKTSSPAAIGARYLRIELPRKGILTLSEVEVTSGGSNIASTGKATQSSTSNGGEAGRAIDGRTDGNFSSNTLTHTEEEKNPWWELDLGKQMPLEGITLWNRSEGNMASRLDGFEIVLLDANRNEVLRKPGNPAPERSVALPLSEDIGGTLRLAAISAAVSTGQDAAGVYKALIHLIGKGEVVDAATLAIGRLPRDSWSGENVAAALDAIRSWAAAIPLNQRSGKTFTGVMDVAENFANLLPADQRSAATEKLRNFGIRVVRVSTVPEQMRFNLKRIVVEAGKPFEVVFDNPDAMPHNILFIAGGTRQAIAEAVQTSPPTKLDAKGRAYVPDKDKRVLGASKLLEAGQKETFQVQAPSEEGTHEFVCSFPGHWTIMWGELVVTKDVAAYLEKNPAK